MVTKAISLDVAYRIFASFPRVGARWEGAGAPRRFQQEPGDRELSECDLDPAHRPAATRARVEIGAGNVGQKPRPTVTWWGSVDLRVVVVAEGGKAELITARCRRPSLGRVVSVSGYNFAAQSRVARKNPEYRRRCSLGGGTEATRRVSRTNGSSTSGAANWYTCDDAILARS